MADKGQNLERLGRHLKLFTDKTEHTGSLSRRLGYAPQPRRVFAAALVGASTAQQKPLLFSIELR
jgi:hypothetical protein